MSEESRERVVRLERERTTTSIIKEHRHHPAPIVRKEDFPRPGDLPTCCSLSVPSEKGFGSPARVPFRRGKQQRGSLTALSLDPRRVYRRAVSSRENCHGTLLLPSVLYRSDDRVGNTSKVHPKFQPSNPESPPNRSSRSRACRPTRTCSKREEASKSSLSPVIRDR